MNGRRRSLLRASAAHWATLWAMPIAAQTGLEEVVFAALGDLPYSARDEAVLTRVLEDLQRVATFAVHVGDIKSGAEVCSDGLLKRRLQLLDQSPVPLVYVPGDNEWTDCHSLLAGRYLPSERLAFLRQHAYPDLRSMGRRKLTLERQQGAAGSWPENQRWRSDNMLFATINQPGSNNGAGIENITANEIAERNHANDAWLKDSFAIASQRHWPLVLFMQADPDWGDHALANSGRTRRSDGHFPLKTTLRTLLSKSTMPVLVVHGDSHVYRFDRPWQASGGQAARLHRLCVPGFPTANQWVRVTARPGQPNPFAAELQSV